MRPRVVTGLELKLCGLFFILSMAYHMAQSYGWSDLTRSVVYYWLGR